MGLVVVLGAGTASAASGPSISFTSVSPNLLQYTGTGTVAVTVNVLVLDSSGIPVTSDFVQLSGDGQQFLMAPPSPPSTDTYSATIILPSQEGSVSLTATDVSTTPNLAATTTVFQYTPPLSIVLAPNPISLTANGIASTTVTATVTDGAGQLVDNDPLTITSSSGPNTVSAVSSGSPGVYTATITSTTTPGPYMVTASDGIAPDATATLNEYPLQTLTLGAFNPSAVTADGSSRASALATLTDAGGDPVAGEAADISIASSDPNVHPTISDTGNGTYTVVVTSSKVAHPITVTASIGGLTANSTVTQVAGPATSVSLGLSPNVVTANGFATSTAAIRLADANGNPVSGDPIHVSTNAPNVHVGSVTSSGNGVYLAKLTSSNIPQTVSITATDTKTHRSAQANLTQIPAASLTTVASMQWTFLWGPRSTSLRALTVNGTPIGGKVKVLCKGGGCPFKQKTVPVQKHKCPKGKKHKGCQVDPPVNLARLFAGHRLKPGTKVTVEVLRRGWIGKYYFFQMRSGTSPRISISCLAPGGSTPGFGCQ